MVDLVAEAGREIRTVLAAIALLSGWVLSILLALPDFGTRRLRAIPGPYMMIGRRRNTAYTC